MEEGWESIFKKGVLERGKQYYIEGRVELLEYDNIHLEGEVLGTEFYNVQIDLNNEQILKMKCTCPYAKEHPYCKHMASVLYAVENSNIILKEAATNENSIDDLIDSLSDIELKKILKQILKNSSLKREFKLKYKRELSKTDKDYYINKIRMIFSFSGWDDVQRHINIIENINIRLLEFIEEEFIELLKYEKYELIFNLFKEISENINLIIEKYRTTDNSPYINELTINATKIIKSLMKNDIGENLENKIFNFVLHCLKNYKTRDNPFYNYYESIFLHKFEGPYYLLKKEEFLNTSIKTLKNDNNIDKLKTILILKYKLLRLEGREEDIKNILSEYHLINQEDI